MALTIVNDYFFKPDGDVEEGKAAAAELVEYFKADVPEVELSLKCIPSLDLFLAERHVVVLVKIVLKGRNPEEIPTHSFFVLLQHFHRRSRDCNHGNVSLVEV